MWWSTLLCEVFNLPLLFNLEDLGLKTKAGMQNFYIRRLTYLAFIILYMCLCQSTCSKYPLAFWETGNHCNFVWDRNYKKCTQINKTGFSPSLPVWQLLDMKVFVDTDSDIRLIRRLKRDISQRGRDISGIIKQYNKFVKPAFEQYIEPTVQSADIVVPRGQYGLLNTSTIFLYVSTLHTAWYWCYWASAAPNCIDQCAADEASLPLCQDDVWKNLFIYKSKGVILLMYSFV